MKKRIAALCLAACCMLTGAASASGLSASDSLVSRSYLEGTVGSSLKTRLDTAVNNIVQSGYQSLSAAISQKGQAMLEAAKRGGSMTGLASGWNASRNFSPVSGKTNHAAAVSAGSSLLWVSGSGVVQQGRMVDVTAGTEVSQGAQVSPGHRYLAVEESVVLVTSASAQWAQEGVWASSALNSPNRGMPYLDVSKSAWYVESVAKAYERKVMMGTGTLIFSPTDKATRVMFMVMVGRMAGADVYNSTPWYQKGWDWAVANKISDGTDPNGNITREQIVSMLWRYAGRETVPGDYISDFPDCTSVSSWAQQAMNWAVYHGIVVGSDGLLLPKSSATRAEIAAICVRFQALMGNVLAIEEPAPSEEPEVTPQPTQEPEQTPAPSEGVDGTSQPAQEPEQTPAPSDPVESQPVQEPEATPVPSQGVDSQPSIQPDGTPAPSQGVESTPAPSQSVEEPSVPSQSGEAAPAPGQDGEEAA